MKSILYPTLLALLTSASLAEVKLTVGDISDKRTTGQFFKGFEIELNLTGPEIVDARAIRKGAIVLLDDTGKEFPKAENTFHSSDDFQDIERDRFGSDGKEVPATTTKLKLEYGNPPRTAKSIQKLSGTLELLIPKNDPASVVTASVAKDAGKPLENPALKALGVEITILKHDPAAKKSNEFGFAAGIDEGNLGYEIKDPSGKVASIEFCSADGKRMETRGGMSTGSAGKKWKSISFDQKPPADAIVKIYLLTAKSIVNVPLNLTAIPLP